MEKYTIDLEKVLDEFEYNEEKNDRISADECGPEGYSSHLLKSTAVDHWPHFDCINLADADYAGCTKIPAVINYSNDGYRTLSPEGTHESPAPVNATPAPSTNQTLEAIEFKPDLINSNFDFSSSPEEKSPHLPDVASAVKVADVLPDLRVECDVPSSDQTSEKCSVIDFNSISIEESDLRSFLQELENDSVGTKSAPHVVNNDASMVGGEIAIDSVTEKETSHTAKTLSDICSHDLSVTSSLKDIANINCAMSEQQTGSIATSCSISDHLREDVCANEDCALSKSEDVQSELEGSVKELGPCATDFFQMKDAYNSIKLSDSTADEESIIDQENELSKENVQSELEGSIENVLGICPTNLRVEGAFNDTPDSTTDMLCEVDEESIDEMDGSVTAQLVQAEGFNSHTSSVTSFDSSNDCTVHDSVTEDSLQRHSSISQQLNESTVHEHSEDTNNNSVLSTISHSPADNDADHGSFCDSDSRVDSSSLIHNNESEEMENHKLVIQVNKMSIPEEPMDVCANEFEITESHKRVIVVTNDASTFSSENLYHGTELSESGNGHEPNMDHCMEVEVLPNQESTLETDSVVLEESHASVVREEHKNETIEVTCQEMEVNHESTNKIIIESLSDSSTENCTESYGDRGSQEGPKDALESHVLEVQNDTVVLENCRDVPGVSTSENIIDKKAATDIPREKAENCDQDTESVNSETSSRLSSEASVDFKETSPPNMEHVAKGSMEASVSEVGKYQRFLSPEEEASGRVQRPTSLSITPHAEQESDMSSTSAGSGRILTPEEQQLGKQAPFWVPDSEAPMCMHCHVKFTVIKRRHHCRGCGQVLCSKCCDMKARLEYMDFAEARVCHSCHKNLEKKEASGSQAMKRPNPNNPMEYCSTIPPALQVTSSNQPPPAVLVPVPVPTGVLKREGKAKTSDIPKQVIFSDGIRPGGDLTELDLPHEPRLPLRKPFRMTRRMGLSAANILNKRHLNPETKSFIPSGENELPPIIVRNQEYSEIVNPIELNTPPLKFAVNRNLFLHVSKIFLNCCVNREVWCMTTEGLPCVGQDEVSFIIETFEDEKFPPKDVFVIVNNLYRNASEGNTLTEMSFLPSFSNQLLGSKEHGGFIFIRSTFQCTQKLNLPNPPFLVALLIHRWETPWARLFPVRLILRLGAEYRYYPCPLFSVRHRPALFSDIGHTIVSLLADFRMYSFSLPVVQGLFVHMEDRLTTILLPRNRYDQVLRALKNSDENVLTFAGNISTTADSHLVCIQSTTGDCGYQTQAINIHNKPRQVTGASFVVFNGSLKQCGWSGKSNIVEDGLMVQIPNDSMAALRLALNQMKDFTIGCGPQAEEMVVLKWTDDDVNFNVGVRSCIDRRPLDGVPSIRVHNGVDYSGPLRFIRWTEVFIIQADDGNSNKGAGETVNIQKLSESIARATCVALLPYLDLLSTANLTVLGVRATIDPDNVGYEAGSRGERLPPLYMKSLDEELVAIVNQAAVSIQDVSTPVILELVFRIMEQS